METQGFCPMTTICQYNLKVNDLKAKGFHWEHWDQKTLLPVVGNGMGKYILLPYKQMYSENKTLCLSRSRKQLCNHKYKSVNRTKKKNINQATFTVVFHRFHSHTTKPASCGKHYSVSTKLLSQDISFHTVQDYLINNLKHQGYERDLWKQTTIFYL